MYEFDLKFPYESQLVIGVKDWDALVGKKSSLIGKTTIDLEDRFYSQCYATCGLPKKYETEGYNKWRDVLSPTQILNKLRRQWRLKKPEYTSDNLLKITNLDERTFVFSLDHSVVIVGENDDIDQNRRHDSIAAGLVDSELKKSNTTVVTTSPGFGGQNSLFRFDSTENNDPRIIKVLGSLLSNKKNKPSLIVKLLLKEKLALKALNEWETITGSSLVKEHVETRSLFNPETPDIEQGKLEMWIDMFSMEDINNLMSSSQHVQSYQIPKPVDITPRKPKKFQLRIIIYNTEEVILDDVNPMTGEKTSDIYIKSFLCDKISESQSTDVHYRSMNGEGS